MTNLCPFSCDETSKQLLLAALKSYRKGQGNKRLGHVANVAPRTNGKL